MVHRDSSGINRVLLEADLRRAKALAEASEPFQRPTRNVTIVDAWTAASTASMLLKAPMLVCDLEAFDSESASCIGFATSPSQAYVFPPPVFDAAFRVLKDHPSLCFQNGGTYDKYMVETRLGVRLSGYRHDTIVQWHTLYPEIAGAAKDSEGKQKGTKQTQKGLHFLASLYTFDRWWKDYDFASAEEEWTLNGKDCCITFDCFLQMSSELRSEGLWPLYLRQMDLTFILDDVRQRGLAVDNGLRIERLEMLEGANKDASMKLEHLLTPLLHERRDRLEKEHLFFRMKACGCCNGGKSKKAECWSCAGFEKKPSKKQLGDIELKPCEVCSGAGKEEHFLGFNPGSGDQVKDILYNVLKLPKRYKDGSLTTDEEALRGLLKEVV